MKLDKIGLNILDAEEIAFSSYILPTINLVDSEEAPGLVLTQDIENGEELPEQNEYRIEIKFYVQDQLEPIEFETFLSRVR